MTPGRGGKVGVGDVLYRYNGIERNEELGLDLAFYRSYDPAIGRWLQVDPLAEAMPSMTPYRFGFNNPILWSDPLGLFESRKEAREYRRTEKNGLNWFNSSVVKQKDGSYAIETNESTTQAGAKDDLLSQSEVATLDDDRVVRTTALAAAPATNHGPGPRLSNAPDKIEPIGYWEGLFSGYDRGNGHYNSEGYLTGPAWQGGMSTGMSLIGGVGSAGVKAVSTLSRVPKGEIWVNVADGILRKGGQWLPKGVKNSSYLKFTQMPKGSPLPTQLKTHTGRPSRYNDMKELLDNMARQLGDINDGPVGF